MARTAHRSRRTRGRLPELPRGALIAACIERSSWRMRTILLLIGSNVFMTCAWYGHLKYRASPLWIVILASWAIAFFEYCLQVPANRIGYGEFSAGQLKIIQEIITLTVFAGFSVLYLGEMVSWRYAGAFVCLLGAVAFMFVGKSA